MGGCSPSCCISELEARDECIIETQPTTQPSDPDDEALKPVVVDSGTVASLSDGPEPQKYDLEPQQKDELGEELEAGLAEVKRLCCVTQLFDALEVLAATENLASESEVPSLSERLERDDTIARLRKRQKHWEKAILPIISACTRTDVEWCTIEESEPKAGSHARVRCSARYLVHDERDPGGVATQGCVLQQVKNIPVPFIDVITKWIELDTFDKSELDSCVGFAGFPGGPEKFHTAYSQSKFAPAPFLKLFDNSVAEFTLCSMPPPGLEEFGPGVLMSDFSVPDAEIDAQGCYDGFKVLEKPSWFMRMRNSGAIYWTPSSEDPGCTNMASFSQIHIPVPEWMLPVRLGVSMFVNMGRETLIKAGRTWKEAEKLAMLARRRERTPLLYAAIEELAVGAPPAA